MNVPDSNILMVTNLPAPGDNYDISEYRVPDVRKGTCYTVRKMHLFHKGDVNVLHDAKDELLPEGLHEQQQTFLRNEYFVSYDPHTLLIYMASMLGNVPIVVPLMNMSKEEWFSGSSWGPYSRDTKRAGLMHAVAYGFFDSEVESARLHTHVVRSELFKVKHWGKSTVLRMIDDVKSEIDGSGACSARRLVRDYFPSENSI